jgi:hypothetical protein
MNEEFSTQLRLNRPKLGDTTIAGYLSTYNKLRKETGLDLTHPSDFITSIDTIFKYLKTIPFSSRKGKIAAIVSLLDTKGPEPHSKELVDALERYRKQMMKDITEYNEAEQKQSLNDRQQQAFMPWEDVLERYKALETECTPLLHMKILTYQQMKRLQNYVLLSLYVLIPPRRSKDYTDFKIRHVDSDKDNYLLLHKRKPAQFVFNSYKNGSRVGKQILDIPDNLKVLILRWIHLNPYDYLLVGKSGEKITQSRLTKLLNDIFGKNISSSMLRHIYATHRVGHVNLEDLMELTTAMGNAQVSRTLKYVHLPGAKQRPNLDLLLRMQDEDSDESTSSGKQRATLAATASPLVAW